MIEAALAADGVALADEYLAALEKSKKDRDQDHLTDIVLVFEEFARTGELIIPRELNELRDGLWEIKVGKARFPFFYLAESAAGALRLTHWFKKGTDKTPIGEINKANWVRGKDLEQ